MPAARPAEEKKPDPQSAPADTAQDAAPSEGEDTAEGGSTTGGGDAGQSDPAEPDTPMEQTADYWAGSWHGPECNGEDESYPYLWTVSLLKQDEKNIVGTIRFHDCDGAGGYVVYQVHTFLPVASIAEDGRLGVSGKLTDSSGALGTTTPEIQDFLLSKGGAPDPNLVGR